MYIRTFQYRLEEIKNIIINIKKIKVMKEVKKFFGLKEGETQVCNGFFFACIKKEVLCEGSAPTLFGTLTTPEGEIVDYTVKGVFANKLNKLAGVACTTTIPSKVDNSQQKGENKVTHISMSVSKQQKRFLKAYKHIKQASELYGLTDAFGQMIEALLVLDDYAINCEGIKRQQAIEAARFEAEAKAKAEAEAKAEAARIEAQKQMIELAAKNAGISIEEAEKNLRALGMIK